MASRVAQVPLVTFHQTGIMTTGQRNQNHYIMRAFSLTLACISLVFASLAQPVAYNSGTELVRTKDFTGPVERLPFPLEADECVDAFEKVHDNRFVGLNSKLDGEGASRTGTLFETDAGFKDFRPIKQYDFLRYHLNSIEVLDDTVYILLFDRKLRYFLLERITLPPLGQPLLGR